MLIGGAYMLEVRNNFPNEKSYYMSIVKVD